MESANCCASNSKIHTKPTKFYIPNTFSELKTSLQDQQNPRHKTSSKRQTQQNPSQKQPEKSNQKAKEERSLLTMWISSNPESASVLRSSHPMPPAPTMSTFAPCNKRKSTLQHVSDCFCNSIELD